MEYLYNKQLKRIRSDWKGNPHDGTEFQYIDRPFKPDWKVIFKMMLSKNPQAKAKRKDDWRPEVHHDSSYLDTTEDFIVWLGHASFLIQINGKRILTDPVFYNIALLQRFVPIPIELDDLTNLDYLILSHDHRDHCDKKSLTAVLEHANPTILTTLKMNNVIQSWVGDTPIQEAGWYQMYETKDVEIIFLPSQHWCRRGLTDFNRVLWGSFIIRTPEKTIYFGGDSASGKHFEEIGKLFPNIDVCMLGIGAYKPDFMMQEVHTSPAEAKDAFEQLGAKKMIPMHYGTYDLSWEPISEPFYNIQSLFEGTPEKLLPLGVGEPYFFNSKL